MRLMVLNDGRKGSTMRLMVLHQGREAALCASGCPSPWERQHYAQQVSLTMGEAALCAEGSPMGEAALCAEGHTLRRELCAEITPLGESSLRRGFPLS